MATHDPMDLDARSQDFFRDFYLFHKHSCDAWYIKDANHRFVDASISFLSRFLPSGLTSVTGLGDNDISSASRKDIKRMHDFENEALLTHKELNLFSCKYFISTDGPNFHVLNFRSLIYSNENCIMVYVHDITSLSSSIDWISYLTCDSSEVNPDINIMSYEDLEPLQYVTNKEWEVAWLLLCGYSFKQIEKKLQLNSRTVLDRARNTYLKLRVGNKGNLFRVAGFYNWLRFVPEKYCCETRLDKIL